MFEGTKRVLLLKRPAYTPPPVGPVPVNTVAPAVTGSYVQGEALACSTGTWTNSPTAYAYQWRKGGVDINGATTNSYTPVAGDVGASIDCRVTASNGNGAGAPALSNAGTITAAPTGPVFNTTLDTGTLSSKTVTTGMAADLVWRKSRSTALDHYLFDTVRGATKILITDSTAAEQTVAQTLTSFQPTGFTLGTSTGTNKSGDNFVSWSFKRAAKFFDIVTFTSTGSAQTIPHGLNSAPGMIVVKALFVTSSWIVYHRSRTASERLLLNLTNASSATTEWGNVEPTSTDFTVNQPAGIQFVAYLFAHEPSGVIQCGQYTGNGSTTGPVINLGWDPQWLMFKRADTAGFDWVVVDTSRGLAASGAEGLINPNTAAVEVTGGDRVNLTGSGFQLSSGYTTMNANGGSYIYMAIKA